MKKNRLLFNKEFVLSFALALLVSYFPILNLVNTVFNLFVYSGFIYDSLVFYFFFFAVVLYATVLIIPHMKLDVILLLVFLLTAFLLTYTIYEDNREFMFTSLTDFLNNPLYILILFSFSGYMLARHIENTSLFIDVFKWFSVVVIISSIITFFLLASSGKVPQYMVFSYNMLAHTVFLTLFSIRSRKVLFSIVSLLGITIIFLAGARGPIIIAVLTFFVWAFTSQIHIGKKFFLLLAIFALVLSTALFQDYIFKSLETISKILSFDSRTIEMILSGRFFYLSERDTLQMRVISQLNLFGNGLYGDRVIVGVYSHNLFLEILSGFGLIIGPFIILSIIIIIFLALSSRDSNMHLIAIVFFSTGILKLFLSGSYLSQEPSFFIFIALGINSYYERIKSIECKNIAREKNRRNSIASISSRGVIK